MDGLDKQLRANGDAHPRLGHGQRSDGVLRLQNQRGFEAMAAEILVHDAAGAVSTLDENEGHVLEGVNVRAVGKLLTHLLRPVAEGT